MQYDFSDYDRLASLALKFVAGSLTEAEEVELSAFLERPGGRKRFEEIIDQENVQREMRYSEMASKREEASLQNIGHVLEPMYRRHRLRPLRRWSLAAACVAGLGLATAMLWQRLHRKELGQVVAINVPKDLPPGGVRATLTLASGKTIVLDSVQKGRLAVDAGTAIDKVDTGVVKYTTDPAMGSSLGGEVTEHNTLTTPKGGVYEAVLPDGSRVYLNSASSLRYPVRFDPKNPRMVTLTGEAFFKVVHDPARPFKVTVNGMTVQVLGTEFNVNGYADEPNVKTTLIRGLVSVTGGGGSASLDPGEQASGREDVSPSVQVVDTSEVVAWRNGWFRWNGTPLDEVMRQLARWYNVQVVYTGPTPQQHLIGRIRRNAPVTDVFRALEINGYHFRIVESDKIQVSP